MKHYNEAVSFRGVCVWNSLGTLPAPDEIEVTVMGPGYGESVVVHLGNGEWLIVDSCIDRLDSKKTAAPLLYLRHIGVNVEQSVRYIVVSHWDDDHVGGIGEVVEACPNADFISSIVFSRDKFTCFVEAISAGQDHTDGGNIQNIRSVLRLLRARGKPIKVSSPTRQLCSRPIVRCWSPSDLDANEFLMHVAQMHPKALEGFRKAILPTSNLTSVVLTIEWPDTAVLLGADMERSPDNRRGWGAVVSEIANIGGVALGDLVKIPHHGSGSGHDQRMWDDLLHKRPIAVMTPFGKGELKERPPKSTDVNRIGKLSGPLYMSARHQISKRPETMDYGVIRSLREGLITITSQRTPMGIVRHRRIPDADWNYEVFGAAFRIK